MNKVFKICNIFFLFFVALFIIGFTKGQSKRPNILFCIADDASFPFMGAYGCNWIKSPAFDWVAQHGILFNNAYAPNNKCAPARATIITGRNSWQLGAAANHVSYFPSKFKSVFEVLEKHGYYTGYTGKGWGPGVAGEKNGKERQLTGKPFNKIKTNPPSKGISNIDYAANFEQFMKERPKDQPFLFWYGAMEPHRRYEFKSGIKKGNKKISDIPYVLPFWPDKDSVRIDLLDYAFELEYFDHHLQQIIELLKKNGELNNTLIIVTADNGMPFPRMKGQEYNISSHIPLAIMWGNGIRKAGRIVNDFISFIDFAPTFLDIAGIASDSLGRHAVTGKSLTDIFYSSKSGTVDNSRSFVLLGKERHDVGRPHDVGYPIRAIVTNDYIYLHNFKSDRWPAGNPETGYLNVDGSLTKTLIIEDRRKKGDTKYWQWSLGKRTSDELYLLQADPYCVNNLATNVGYKDVLDSLKRRLFSLLKKQGDPRIFGKGDIFDKYPYANPNQRNFYNRYMKGEKMEAGWVNKTDFNSAYNLDSANER